MADERDNGAQLSDYVGFLSRRGFLTGAAAAAGAAFLSACSSNAPQTAGNTGAAPAAGNLPFGKPLKAAFSNAGLGATWCAQGKQAAEQWGKWLGSRSPGSTVR